MKPEKSYLHHEFNLKAMKRFDQKGMMIFPSPEKIKKVAKIENLIVIKQCYCPNGHNLVTDQADFDGFSGIVLKVRKPGQEGLVALNPVYGLKHRIAMNVKLVHDELLEILCPECGVALPVYSECSCGGSLVTLFLGDPVDFTNSVLVCNRVDCQNAQIRVHNEMVHYDGMGQVMFE
ncbi:MAG: hypothetical protein MUC31_04485 [Bacteroidales bacterium]|jgi:hypothetical protein|nr:hypothetical protein [Bacteroidales bacterium]